ncbi:hypothetical protein K3495_g13198 [Podosphaera aphanis]|nr:hypothetical protein K3495_g13198 [Podosphaera aphanis]
MERRDTRHGGVRKQDSSDANPMFQAIKANWLDLDSDKQRDISTLLTHKVKRLTESSSGENEMEAVPNDFKSDCQDVEQDSDYEEAIKGSTLRQSYQKCRSSQADGYHHSQPIRSNVLENAGPSAVSHASSSKGLGSTTQGLSKLRDTDTNTSKLASKRAWEVMAREDPKFDISKSRKTIGDQKSAPLLVTRVFDENEGDIEVPHSLRIKGSSDGVYRWALEKDWTFKLPANEAANEPEVQTIQCYADLRAMLMHVGNDSIIVYHAVNYKLTDKEKLGGTDTVAHREDTPRDIDSVEMGTVSLSSEAKSLRECISQYL